MTRNAAEPLSRDLHLQCRALAAVPHEFRGVSAWLNYNCAMIFQTQDAEDSARLRADLKLARAALDKVLPHFDLEAELPQHDPAAVAWFRGCLRSCPNHGAPFLETGALLRRIQTCIEAGDPAAQGIMRDTSRYITAELAPEVSTLFRVLRVQLAQLEQTRKDWADDMRRQGDDAVDSIREVSQMVRLISLNASVEAARAGAAGKAFAVIAGEVKALSESVDGSAQIATDTLRALTDRL